MKSTNPLLTKALEKFSNCSWCSEVIDEILSKGIIHIGFGESCGSDRATKAACQALCSEHSMKTANSVIFFICGGNSLSFSELEECIDIIHQAVGDSKVLWGVEIDDSLGDDIFQVTLLAGFD
jgi:cell division GTPase FtsZ